MTDGRMLGRRADAEVVAHPRVVLRLAGDDAAPTAGRRARRRRVARVRLAAAKRMGALRYTGDPAASAVENLKK